MAVHWFSSYSVKHGFSAMQSLNMNKSDCCPMTAVKWNKHNIFAMKVLSRRLVFRGSALISVNPKINMCFYIIQNGGRLYGGVWCQCKWHLVGNMVVLAGNCGYNPLASLWCNTVDSSCISCSARNSRVTMDWYSSDDAYLLILGEDRDTCFC